MEFEEFQNQHDVGKETAREAWDLADGDPGEARSLLELKYFWLKGQFTDAEDTVHGLFALRWDREDRTLEYCQGVVGSSDKFTQPDPGIPATSYVDKITDLKRSPQQMGGSSDQLVEGLESFWEDPETTVQGDLLAGELDSLETTLRTFLSEELELNNLRLDLNREGVRYLDLEEPEAEEESPEDAEEEDRSEVELPCEAEINPVKGVPVARLNPEHYLYVELQDIPDQYQKLGPKLEGRKDESGLIPARIVSKQTTDAGTVEVRVQFGDNVFGRLTTGKDTSLLVPPDTKQVLEASQNSGQLDWLDGDSMIMIIAGVLLFLLLSVWFFFL